MLTIKGTIQYNSLNKELNLNKEIGHFKKGKKREYAYFNKWIIIRGKLCDGFEWQLTCEIKLIFNL